MNMHFERAPAALNGTIKYLWNGHKRYNIRRCPGAALTARGLADLRKQADVEQLTFDQYAAEIGVAVKLCECGCGQPTRIAKANDPRHGHVKGQGVRFLKGHSHRGKIVSPETRAKLSATRGGDRTPGWRGDDAGYRALHGWLCEHFPKTGTCEECGRTAKNTDYALIHGRTYSRDRNDYRELCHRCHMRYDLGVNPEFGRVFRELRAQGRTTTSIAAEYGVSTATVSRVSRR